MARKNLLSAITGAGKSAPTSGDEAGADMPVVSVDVRAGYTRRGASRSMMQSIDEMAENARRLVDGEAIVDLDPALLDGSFIADRVVDGAGSNAEGEEAFRQLKEAIRVHGQASPILVRPHPDQEGRYMIVFGHRRSRAARELGIPVRAVVKPLHDIGHIIAQGQENTARANLSFIEKALFARKLRDMGQTKETIKAALTIDDTLLSRMLAVADGVPAVVLEALGAARSVGRDRWEELKKRTAHQRDAERAVAIVQSEAFRTAAQEAKGEGDLFAFLLNALKPAGRRAGKTKVAPDAGLSWTPEDKQVAATFHRTGKAFNLTLTQTNAGEFGLYLKNNIDALYRAFKEDKLRD